MSPDRCSDDGVRSDLATLHAELCAILGSHGEAVRVSQDDGGLLLLRTFELASHCPAWAGYATRVGSREELLAWAHAVARVAAHTAAYE